MAAGRAEVESAKESEPSDPAVAEDPTRKGRPEVVSGLPIVEYDPQELDGLARWVMSDGLLRTDTQIFEEMFRELGYRRRALVSKKPFTRPLIGPRKSGKPVC